MKDNTVIPFSKPDTIKDELTEYLRMGAHQLLQQAVECEVEELLEAFKCQRLADGRQCIVRNGYLPEREVQTGLGPVSVSVPKVRDRGDGDVKFNSSLVPPYVRRAASVEAVLPWLYLKGISTGDFQSALSALLGEDAKGLSASTISRLKARWEQEHKDWNRRSLAGRRWVYWWVDGVYLNVRMEEAKQCVLVIIGVDEYGKKEFLAIDDGYRESEQSWLEPLEDLKSRGLKKPPELAIGDGALGFWKALKKSFPKTKVQRCWVHKTANVLNKLPKSIQAKAKTDLQNIWMAETREDAEKAFDLFVAKYAAKYPKAVECLKKDRTALLAFYDFPAEHWTHIRTTNPVESTFATIRLRTAKTRGCLSRRTGLALVWKLAMAAQTGWRRLRGFKRLGELIQGIAFIDGVSEKEIELSEDNRNAA